MASFDFIDNRFFNQYIKVPKVICQEKVQTPAENLAFPAPAGLFLEGDQFFLNGQPVRLTLRKGTRPAQLRTNSIVPDKVSNVGFIYATLIATTPAGEEITVAENIPLQWHDFVDCPGVRPGDIVQKHDFQYYVFPDVTGILQVVDEEEELFLKLLATVHYCLVVASERLMKVNAAEKFC